jgi:flagellar hook protein FlgE
MAFNTALSGLRAASSDLEITGNNIANAATSGFKSSRAEFGDVYAAAFVSGGNTIGGGVVLQSAKQQFSQGTINYTQNALDLAINGQGFFLMKQDGTNVYSRNGTFNIDKDGYVVSNTGAKLQGQRADEQGNPVGEPTDLVLDAKDLSPKATTRISETMNLNASAEILEKQTATIKTAGIGISNAQLGEDNGYTAGTIKYNGKPVNIPSSANMQASAIAAELSDLKGVTASATTTARLAVNSAFPVNANELLINGQSFTGNDINELAADINSASGLTATVVGGEVEIVSSTGANLLFDLTAVPGSGVNFTVQGIIEGTASGAPITLDETNAAARNGVVGGQIEITLSSNTRLTEAETSNVFIANPVAVQNPPTNTFDPKNPETYNSTTTTTVYDSEGVPHNMTQYFVRVPNRPGAEEGTLWKTIVQIDGRDVGGTDPDNPEPAVFELKFNGDGSFDEVSSEQILITNWMPRNPEGVPTGAFGPRQPAELPIPEPATSSNFIIDPSNATSFGGSFAVNSLTQNGYGKGSMTGVEVSENGTIYARYSNGETKSLGQLMLARFPNMQGLTPLGDSLWADSIDSGQPIIGAPSAGQMGGITAGALEGSNVDLTKELVNLILAQRNFQANAKSIETSDAVTQTIINMR